MPNELTSLNFGSYTGPYPDAFREIEEEEKKNLLQQIMDYIAGRRAASEERIAKGRGISVEEYRSPEYAERGANKPGLEDVMIEMFGPKKYEGGSWAERAMANTTTPAGREPAIIPKGMAGTSGAREAARRGSSMPMVPSHGQQSQEYAEPGQSPSAREPYQGEGAFPWGGVGGLDRMVWPEGEGAPIPAHELIRQQAGGSPGGGTFSQSPMTPELAQRQQEIADWLQSGLGPAAWDLMAQGGDRKRGLGILKAHVERMSSADYNQALRDRAAMSASADESSAIAKVLEAADKNKGQISKQIADAMFGEGFGDYIARLKAAIPEEYHQDVESVANAAQLQALGGDIAGAQKTLENLLAAYLSPAGSARKYDLNQVRGLWNQSGGP